MFGKRARAGLTLAIVLNLVFAGLVLVPAVGAATTAVTPISMGSWTVLSQRTATGTFVEGPATAPLGEGSFRLTTGAGNAGPDLPGGGAGQGGKIWLATQQYDGTLLADIDELSYETYVAARADGTSVAPAVHLQVDIDGDGDRDTTMVYEPVYSVDAQGAVVLNTWQDWDMVAGKWWFTVATSEFCSFDCFVPFADIVEAHPSAKIITYFARPDGYGLTLDAGQNSPGMPWINFDGNVDNLSITIAGGENTTYDFDPTPEVTLTLTTTGEGSVLVSPPGETYTDTSLTYDQETDVTLEPTAADGYTFAGWIVDGAEGGWDPTLTITMSSSRSVEAVFVETPEFSDVGSGRDDYEAITELAARGFILGYGDGSFGPDKRVLRSEMAALIARAMPKSVADGAPNLLTPPACVAASTWDCEVWNDVNFSDVGDLDPNLTRDIKVLAHYGVALGYGAEGCDDRDLAFPCFGPNDSVTHAQTITFITRAMVEKGYWQYQPQAPQPYSGVPESHDVDVRTFVYYVGGIPDLPPDADWNESTTRGQFAQALWAALETVFGEDPD
jgi:hypothetical protein